MKNIRNSIARHSHQQDIIYSSTMCFSIHALHVYMMYATHTDTCSWKCNTAVKYKQHTTWWSITSCEPFDQLGQHGQIHQPLIRCQATMVKYISSWYIWPWWPSWLKGSQHYRCNTALEMQTWESNLLVLVTATCVGAYVGEEGEFVGTGVGLPVEDCIYKVQ
jgi:hypothetical protein